MYRTFLLYSYMLTHQGFQQGILGRKVMGNLWILAANIAVELMLTD